MTKILIPDQVKTKTLTPSEVRAYNNHRLSEPLPDECVAELFVTIEALAWALRASALYSMQKKALTRVAPWLEESWIWMHFNDCVMP